MTSDPPPDRYPVLYQLYIKAVVDLIQDKRRCFLPLMCVYRRSYERLGGNQATSIILSSSAKKGGSSTQQIPAGNWGEWVWIESAADPAAEPIRFAIPFPRHVYLVPTLEIDYVFRYMYNRDERSPKGNTTNNVETARVNNKTGKKAGFSNIKFIKELHASRWFQNFHTYDLIPKEKYILDSTAHIQRHL